MIIKGWVTPRYLDSRWFGNFTVSISNRKNGDIPVVVSVNDTSFKGSFINNNIPGYGDLENEIYTLRQFLIESDQMDSFNEWAPSS